MGYRPAALAWQVRQFSSIPPDAQEAIFVATCAQSSVDLVLVLVECHSPIGTRRNQAKDVALRHEYPQW